ncbi:hypothetical protein C5167_046278 [Papaver somniferum]|uniref:Uncharacterized protein n=1 Tax=Papaver somniferum TaxID=3469 RepID=A0A4Y7LG24_PAPSO|nr:hypothetical protein C5167_046278 [Papaver somniferum]
MTCFFLKHFQFDNILIFHFDYIMAMVWLFDMKSEYSKCDSINCMSSQDKTSPK